MVEFKRRTGNMTGSMVPQHGNRMAEKALHAWFSAALRLQSSQTRTSPRLVPTAGWPLSVGGLRDSVTGSADPVQCNGFGVPRRTRNRDQCIEHLVFGSSCPAHSRWRIATTMSGLGVRESREVTLRRCLIHLMLCRYVASIRRSSFALGVARRSRSMHHPLANVRRERLSKRWPLPT